MHKITWGAPSFWMERFPLYRGIEQGFFADRGTDLRIWYAHGGPELAAAVAKGRIPIGEMGLPPFLAALGRGLQARMVGSSIFQQLDHYLAARPGISGTARLAGCRIGILSAGSCDEFFIRKMLRTRGIDPDNDVDLVPLGKDYGKPEVFTDGRVDAAFVVEPRLSLGQRQGLWRVIDRVADYYPPLPVGHHPGRGDVAATRRKTGRRPDAGPAPLADRGPGGPQRFAGGPGGAGRHGANAAGLAPGQSSLAAIDRT